MSAWTGQVLRLEDGTLVVTRFGHGTAGAVLVVDTLWSWGGTINASVFWGRPGRRLGVGPAPEPAPVGF